MNIKTSTSSLTANPYINNQCKHSKNILKYCIKKLLSYNKYK